MSKKERIQVIGVEARKKLFRRLHVKYQDSFCARAERLCSRHGFTRDDLAAAFGAHPATINAWMRRYPAFAEAVQKGKDVFDCGVAVGSLLRRVTGYNLIEETRELRPTGEIEFDFLTGEEKPVMALVPVKQVTKHLPPDVGAIKMWLVNRAPDRWKEKSAVEIAIHEDLLRKLDQDG